MKLSRLDTPDGRFYIYTYDQNATFKTGGFILMPSVTTVLGSVGNTKLQKLENEIGKEELAKIGAKAARRGTAMHQFLENYFVCMKQGKSPDACLLYTQKKTPLDLMRQGLTDDSIKQGRDLFYNLLYEGYLDRVRRVLFTEQFLYSINHKFAGTTDFGYLSSSNFLTITDFKSANGVKDDETIRKYLLQAAAYVIGCEEIYKKKVHHAELWISHPMGTQEVTLAGAEMELKKTEFLDILSDFHSKWNAKEIIEKYHKNIKNTINGSESENNAG